MSISIKELTQEEMVSIVHSINYDDFIGHGSSRATFGITYEGRYCVAKLAIGVQGENQTRLECSRYLEYGDTGCLNTIIAKYGYDMIICDYVEDYEWFVDEYYNGEEDDWEDYGFSDEEEFISAVGSVTKTVNLMRELQGNTSDNYQIGRNENGDYVAYDYGYIVGENSTYVGNLGNYYDDEILDMFYEKMGLLDEENFDD